MLNSKNNDTKRGISRFFTTSSQGYKLSPSRSQSAVVCKSCTTHWLLVMCNMWHAMLYTWTARLLSFRSHLALFHWLKSLSDKRGEETRVPRENPQLHIRKCHILKSENLSPTETRTRILASGQALVWEADVLTITPQVTRSVLIQPSFIRTHSLLLFFLSLCFT